jgi:DNA-binding MarR family transcriptional regulator
MTTRRTAVDLRRAADLEVAVQIGAAWRNLRRGASSVVVRDHLYGGRTDSLDPGQMDTLDVLMQRPSWRMSDLAEALRVDPSTATRAVQRLEKLDLAERASSTDDRRVVTVNVTNAGRAVHRQVDMRRGFVITKLMSAFTVEERTDLARLMTRFVQELDELVEELPTSTPSSIGSIHG